MTEPRQENLESAIEQRPIFDKGFYEGRKIKVGFEDRFELRKIKFSGDIGLGKLAAIMRQLDIFRRYKQIMEGVGLSDHMMLDVEIAYPEPYPHLVRNNIMSGNVSELFRGSASPLQIEISFDQKERKLIVRGSPR